MTKKEYGEIVDARIDGDKIVYTAEYPDGGEARGILTREIGPYSVLSDSAMEDLVMEE